MATDEFRVVAIYINLTLAAVAVGNTVELQRSSLSTASRNQIEDSRYRKVMELSIVQKKKEGWTLDWNPAKRVECSRGEKHQRERNIKLLL